jgi:hypothetical protein
MENTSLVVNKVEILARRFTMNGNGQTTKDNEGNTIFKIAEIIVRDYLRLDKENSFIQEHGEDILGKLEKFYREEGCCPNGDDKEEKMFILRSLPLISSVVQLSTTIKHFNGAMEEVEKLYEIEDNPFEQAIKLSYLVFAFAINRGCQLFSQDAKRSEIWNQMREQIVRLLKPKLNVPGRSPGDYWYDSARNYAQQVPSRRGDIEKIKAETLDEPTRESELARMEAQIKNIIGKAVQKLRQAIDIDPKHRGEAINDKAFDSIRDNPDFKKLIGEEVTTAS